MTRRDLYSTPRWRKLREAILARDGHRCQIRLPGCTGQAREVDHIVPVEHGGAWWDPANLRASCARCNRSRGAALTNRDRARALRELRGRDDPCRVWPHLEPGDPPCPRCGTAPPSRRW